LEKRLKVHLAEHQKSLKVNWVKSLRSKSLKPIIIELEECLEEELNQNEVFWIAFAKSCGAHLLNMALGGEGGNMTVAAIIKMRATKKANLTPERRARLSAAQRGRKQTPEHISKRMAHKIGKPLKQETRAKIAAAHQGMRHKPETIQKLKVRKIKPMSDETRKKLSESHKGAKLNAHQRAVPAWHNQHKVFTPETREKMRLAKLGKKQTPEQVEKRIKAIRGRPRTEEDKEKMSEGWARRRALGLKRKPRSY
jgi:hypothetical protein